ncbi:DUF4129 domain-containing protein [Modestobacter sp. SYSU DS0290]
MVSPPPAGPGRPVLRTAIAVGALLAVLALATLAARAGSYATPLPPSATAASIGPAAPSRALPTPSEDAAGPTTLPLEPGRNVIGEVTVWLVLLLALAGLGLLIAMGTRWRPRLPGRRPPAAAATTGGGEPGALPAAVDRALAAVEQPDARDAVVAAWLLLGRAAADARTPAHPAETSAEYGARLAAVHGLPAPSVDRLAELYRTARFSSHPIGPAERAAARAGLEELRAALATGAGTAGDRR